MQRPTGLGLSLPSELQARKAVQPVPAPSAVAAAAEDAPLGGIPRSTPIMVVDDSEIDRMVAEGFIEDLGYTCVAAGSGLEALKLLREMVRDRGLGPTEAPVGLILLDVLMPQMDGYETLKTLKGDRRLRNIPVIMITSIDDRANIASFLRAGVDDYVLKPLVLPELQVRLNVCLERRRLLNWVDTLEQTEDGVEPGGAELRNSWTFWFDDPPSQDLQKSSWDAAMQQLGSFSTIREFWEVWGGLDIKLPEYSNFRLFKQGIQPTWEDAANKSGGKVVIRCKKSDTSRIWFELILIVITEQLQPSSALCGIVLSIRPNENMVSLWLRSEMEEQTPFLREMSDALRGLLGLKPSMRIFHQYHRDRLAVSSKHSNMALNNERKRANRQRQWRESPSADMKQGWLTHSDPTSAIPPSGRVYASAPVTPDASSDRQDSMRDASTSVGIGGDLLTERLHTLAMSRTTKSPGSAADGNDSMHSSFDAEDMHDAQNLGRVSASSPASFDMNLHDGVETGWGEGPPSARADETSWGATFDDAEPLNVEQPSTWHGGESTSRQVTPTSARSKSKARRERRARAKAKYAADAELASAAGGGATAGAGATKSPTAPTAGATRSSKPPAKKEGRSNSVPNIAAPPALAKQPRRKVQPAAKTPPPAAVEGGSQVRKRATKAKSPPQQQQPEPDSPQSARAKAGIEARRLKKEANPARDVNTQLAGALAVLWALSVLLWLFRS